jgi:anti-anti-sigma factor
VPTDHEARDDEPQTTVLATAGECTVELARPDGVATISITGELDLENADEVFESIRPVIASEQTVAVDLHRLEFVDSYGISRLIAAQQTADAAGVQMVVRRPRPATRRVLSISGLLSFLHVE